MGLFDKAKKAAKQKISETVTKHVPFVSKDNEQDEIEVVRTERDGAIETTYFSDGTSIQSKHFLTERVIFNVNCDKTPYFSSERVEIPNGTFVQLENGSIAYVLDGIKEFEINKRMKAYKQLEPFLNWRVSNCIAERHHGEHGDYYTIWTYFRKDDDGK